MRTVQDWEQGRRAPAGRRDLRSGLPNNIRMCSCYRDYPLSYYLPKAIIPRSAWTLGSELRTDGVFGQDGLVKHLVQLGYQVSLQSPTASVAA